MTFELEINFQKLGIRVYQLHQFSHVGEICHILRNMMKYNTTIVLFVHLRYIHYPQRLTHKSGQYKSLDPYHGLVIEVLVSGIRTSGQFLLSLRKFLQLQ